MFEKLKEALWWLGLWPERKCPKCGSSLTAHGFEPERRFTCDNPECDFR